MDRCVSDRSRKGCCWSRAVSCCSWIAACHSTRPAGAPSTTAGPHTVSGSVTDQQECHHSSVRCGGSPTTSQCVGAVCESGARGMVLGLGCALEFLSRARAHCKRRLVVCIAEAICLCPCRRCRARDCTCACDGTLWMLAPAAGDIFSMQDLLLSLRSLVTSYPQYERWMLKVGSPWSARRVRLACYTTRRSLYDALLACLLPVAARGLPLILFFSVPLCID